MRNEISNSDDIVDSRDVIARIAELETELADAHEDDAEHEVLDMRAELATLQELASEAEGYAPDWHHGTTLIRESYFVEYAQQLAEDLGCINAEASWPNDCIDWERAARELRMDYTAVDFGGVTYFIR